VWTSFALAIRTSMFHSSGPMLNCERGNGACCPCQGDRLHILKSNVEMGHTSMIRIGYPPAAFDLFRIGSLNLLRRAWENCDYLVAGVVADEVLIEHKGVTSVIPLAERLEIVCNVRFDAAVAALTNDKVAIWKDLRFNVLFKGNDWQGTEKKGNKLEREFAPLGVEIAYCPYTLATSSSALRRTLQNIDTLAGRASNRAVLARAA
jgi:glycerol-3-phosphate cytidylyltransferase